MSVSKVSTRKVQVQNLQNAQVIEKSKGMSKADQSIFDKLDIDQNGVIDADELNALIGADKNGNEKLTRREVKNFLKQNNLDLKNKDVIEFLNKYGIKSGEIESAVTTGEGADKKVTINYGSNGGTKTISANGAYETKRTDENNNQVTTSYSKDNIRGTETIVSADGKLTTETSYGADGTTPSVKIETTKENGESVSKVSTTTYNNGKVSQNVTEDVSGKTKTTTDYTLNGAGNEIPSKQVTVSTEASKPFEETINYSNGVQTDRTLVQGTVTSKYQTVNGKEYLTQKLENLSTDAVRTTNYTYSANGTKEEIIEPNGNKTINITNTEGKKTSQTKVIDGKETTAFYDGSGNTVGFEVNGQQVQIAFQNRMSVKQFCNMFGCSVEEFKAANGGKTKFTPGEAVKIPGEIAANDQKLLSLKTPEQARAEFVRDEQIRAQQEAQRKAQQEANRQFDQALRTNFGLINYTGRGQKKEGTYAGGTKETFTIIGQAKFERTIVQDKKGNIHVIAKGGTILKDSYAMNTAKYKSVLVGKTRVAVVGARNDGHGRQIALDANGNQIILSQKNQILKNKFVEASDRADRCIDMVPSKSDPSVFFDKETGFTFKDVVPRNDPRRFDENGNYREVIIAQPVNPNTIYKADAQLIIAELNGKKQTALNANSDIVNSGIMRHIDAHFAGTKYGSYHKFLADKFSDKDAYVLEADLVANGAIQNQERRDNIISQNITTYGGNIENLEAGYSAITTDADKQGALKAAEAYIQKHDVKAPHGYQGLSALDILAYHQTDGDSKEIRVANDALYNDKAPDLFTSDEVIMSRGSEVSYFLDDGDIDGALQYADATQLFVADSLRQSAGQKTIHDLVPPSYDHVQMGYMAKIMDTGYIPYTDGELLAVALRYVNDRVGQKPDARYTAYNEKLLTGILRTPGAMEQFVGVLNGEYKADGIANLADGATLKNQCLILGFNIDTELDKLRLISSEPSENYLSLSEEEQFERQENMAYVRNLVDGLQIDWNRMLNDEGYIDAMINEVRTAGWGGTTGSMGVTRGQMKAKLLELRKTVNDLQLASEGRLYRGDGTEVDFNNLLANFYQNYMQGSETTYANANGEEVTVINEAGFDKLVGSMSDYKSAQETGHTALDIAITLIPVAKGAALGIKAAQWGSRVFRMGNFATKATRIASASVASGALTGASQYTADRTNHLSSVTGDNIENRVAAEQKAIDVGVTTGVSVGVGMGVGELVAPLYSKAGSKLAKTEEVLQKAIARAEGVGAGTEQAVQVAQRAHKSAQIFEKACQAAGVTTEVGLNALSDTILTNLIYNREMTEQELILSIAGNLVGAANSARGEVGAAKGRTHQPTQSHADLAAARHEVGRDIQATNRAEGRAIQRQVTDENQIIQIGKQRIAYSQQGEEVMAAINQSVKQDAKSVLGSKQGVLAPHDARTLEDHLVNNLHTEKEVEDFMSQLQERVGYSEIKNASGETIRRMHVYQVQGVDEAARVMNVAKNKLNALKAKNTSLDQTLAMMTADKGMDAQALASARGVMDNPAATLEDLQALRDAAAQTTKFGGQQKLLKDLDAQIAQIKGTSSGSSTKTHTQTEQTKETATTAEAKKAEEAHKAEEAKKAEEVRAKKFATEYASLPDENLISSYEKVNKQWQKANTGQGLSPEMMANLRDRRAGLRKEIETRKLNVEFDNFGAISKKQNPSDVARGGVFWRF